ncbi:hypothetical protein [Rhizobium sp. NFR07]|uniref:hypothetical protein n=1 Tax=Rhizobium sp. NFR07 TaxID=1566262 RepID=UPI001160B72F|nr:hypothetical protein [Rhizobium sp. NFR07]
MITQPKKKPTNGDTTQIRITEAENPKPNSEQSPSEAPYNDDQKTAIAKPTAHTINTRTANTTRTSANPLTNHGDQTPSRIRAGKPPANIHRPDKETNAGTAEAKNEIAHRHSPEQSDDQDPPADLEPANKQVASGRPSHPRGTRQPPRGHTTANRTKSAANPDKSADPPQTVTQEKAGERRQKTPHTIQPTAPIEQPLNTTRTNQIPAQTHHRGKPQSAHQQYPAASNTNPNRQPEPARTGPGPIHRKAIHHSLRTRQQPRTAQITQPEEPGPDEMPKKTEDQRGQTSNPHPPTPRRNRQPTPNRPRQTHDDIKADRRKEHRNAQQATTSPNCAQQQEHPQPHKTPTQPPEHRPRHRGQQAQPQQKQQHAKTKKEQAQEHHKQDGGRRGQQRNSEKRRQQGHHHPAKHSASKRKLKKIPTHQKRPNHNQDRQRKHKQTNQQRPIHPSTDHKKHTTERHATQQQRRERRQCSKHKQHQPQSKERPPPKQHHETPNGTPRQPREKQKPDHPKPPKDQHTAPPHGQHSQQRPTPR